MSISNNKGFSLIELLIALAISIALLTSMYSVYQSFHRNFTIQHAIAEMETNARVSLELMVRMLKNAVVVISDSTSSVVFYIDNDDAEIGLATGPGIYNNTLEDTTKLWTTNEWCDKDVTISSGTGSGQVRTIISNTSTSFDVSGDWTKNPDSTSVYHIDIVRRGFSWSSSDCIFRYISGGSGAVTFTTDISNLTFNRTADKIDILLTARTSIKDPQNGQYYTYTLACPVAFRN